MNCNDNIGPGGIISFTTHKHERAGVVESAWTCDASGVPTLFEPTHARYFVFEIIAGERAPGHMLVLPSDEPKVLVKYTGPPAPPEEPITFHGAEPELDIKPPCAKLDL